MTAKGILFNMDVQQQITFLTEQLTILQDKVYKLEERKRKQARSDFNATMLLEEMKEDFLRKELHNYNGVFTNDELVLWYGYLLVNTPQAEKIGFVELKKRVKKIKDLYSFF